MLILFSELVPGEAFTKEHVPHVVHAKLTHTWAAVTWKGVRTEVPLHPDTLVRRTDKTNP